MDADFNSVDSRRLSELLRAATSFSGDFETELREQLETPLTADLDAADLNGLAGDMDTADWRARLTTFGELLADPRPPLGLLQATKRFAKSHREHGSSLLPPQVATVLYYASIAAALVRCERRISDLSDAKLREGFDWCIARDWVGDGIRELLVEAAGRVGD